MGKYFRTSYLYIVVFATLCMVIVGFVGTVNGIVSYAYPAVDEYEIEDVYYNYDEYTKEDGYSGFTSNIQNLVRVEQRASLKSAFTCLAVFVSGLPLYVFHVKQIKKESEKEV